MKQNNLRKTTKRGGVGFTDTNLMTYLASDMKEDLTSAGPPDHKSSTLTTRQPLCLLLIPVFIFILLNLSLYDSTLRTALFTVVVNLNFVFISKAKYQGLTPL